MPADVTFTVLGPVGAAVRDQPVRIPGRRERAVLAVLLAAQRAPVSSDRLVAEVWGAEVPATVTASLQVAVSRLRGLLEPERTRAQTPRLLVTTQAGYALRTPEQSVDADRVATLLGEARERLTDDPVAAAERCDRAAAEWQGEPYAGDVDSDLVRAERVRLNELRLQLHEVRTEALLAAGRPAAVVADLEALVEANPFRERFWEFYALALYRGGRQADALAALRTARTRLGDELGVDPSPRLQDLEIRILNHDPALTGQAPTERAVAGQAVAGGGAPAARAEAATRTPVDGGRAVAAPSRSPLVGRDVEFGRLRGRLSQAAAGETSFALVEGDPGIGKTRLLEELAAAARDSGAQVVWGRCSQAAVAPAFWPWLEVLRALPAEIGTATTPSGLSEFLDPDRTGGEDLTQDRRFRLFDSVARALTAAAGRAPLLVVIEDLHWADAASAELLHHLVDTVYDAPLAVAVSLRELDLGRADAVADVVGAIARRPQSLRVRLGGVAPVASEALIAGVADRAVSAEVSAAIHRRGEGNPFCMGELTRLLASAGALEDASVVERVDVPAGVRDVVRRRLAALPDASRQLLEVAAVIGREFDLDILVGASGRSIDECLDELEPALVSHVVTAVPDVPSRHRFAHALVTEAALAEMSSLRAARLHARVAEAITSTRGEVEIEIVAAHLWAAAAVVGADRAADALERAAEVSIRRTAYEVAQDLLERALALRRTSAAGGAARDESELVTTLRLAGLRRARFGYTRAFEAIPLERPKELAIRTGRTDLYMGLLHLHWGALATSAQVGPATDLARQMWEMGSASDDPVARLLADQCWGVQCWHLGRLPEGAQYMRRVDVALQELDTPALARLAMFDSLAFFSAFAVHVLEFAGAAPDADERFEALIRRHPSPYEVVVVANFAAFSAISAGDAERALRWGRRGLAADSQMGFGMFGATAQMYAGWAEAVLERSAAGLETFQRGFERFRAVDLRTALAAMVCLQVEATLAAGRSVEEAQAALEDGEAEARALGEPLTLPYLDVARAAIAAARGASDQAAVHIERAAAGAQQMGNALLARRIGRELRPEGAGLTAR